MLTDAEKEELIRVYKVQVKEFDTDHPTESVRIWAYCLWTDGWGNVVERELIYENSYCFMNAKKYMEQWAEREIQKHNDAWVKRFAYEAYSYTYTPLKYTDTRAHQQHLEYMKRKEDQKNA